MAELKIDIIVNDGAAAAKLSGIEAGLAGLGRQTVKASAEYDALEKRLRAPAPGILDKFNAWRTANMAASESWVKLGRTMQDTGNVMSSTGRAMTVGLTAPIVALGGFALKAAIDFEKGFSGVGKTVDGVMTKTGKLTAFGKELEQGFRDLAKTIPVSVHELTAIGEIAGAMGITKERVLGFTEVIAKVAATTDLTVEAAAASIGKVQNVMGTIGVDTDRFAATLVALGNAGASTESQIMRFAERMGGAANMARITQGEVLGWANAIASVGVEAELGSTAWNRAVVMMGNAVDTGGAKLALFAKVSEMSAKDFATLWRQDASEAMNRFIEGLGKVDAAGGNVSAIMSDLGMKSQGFMITIKNLIGFGGGLRDSLELQAKAWAENAAMEEEFTKKAATTASQLKILYNRIYDVGISLGKELIPHLMAMGPAFEVVLGAMVKAVQLFAAMPTWLQATVLAFLGLVAVLGPLLMAFGALTSAAGTLVVFLGAHGLIPAGLLATQAASGAAVSGMAATGAAATTLALGPLALLATALAGIIWAAPKAWSALTNLYDVYQKGGVKAVVGELGRNVKDDDMSFFKSWRLDQQPNRRRGGAGATALELTTDPTALSGGARMAAARDEADLLKKYGLAAVFGDEDDPFGGAGKEGKKTEAQKAAEKAAADYANFKQQHTGTGDIAEAVQWMRLLAEGTKLTKDETTKLKAALDAAMAAYVALGSRVGPMPLAMLQQWAGLQQANTVAPDMVGMGADTADLLKWKAFSERGLGWAGYAAGKGITPELIMPEVPWATELSQDTIDQNMPALLKKMKTEPGFFGKTFGGAQQFGADMSNTIMGAIQGGGNVGSSIGGSAMGSIAGSLTGGLVKKLAGSGIGKMLGGVLGSVIPGLGTLVGGFLGGKVGGWLGGLFGGGEKKKTAKTRDEWIAQFGGMDKLKQVAGEVGFDLDKMFNAKKVKDFEAEVANLNKTMQAHQDKLKGIQMVIEGVNARVEVFGGKLAAATDAMTKQVLAGLSARGIDPESEQGKALIAAETTAGNAQIGAAHQGEFNLMGAMAVGGFGLALQQESAGALTALTAIKPTLDVLVAAQQTYNFEATETVQKLLDIAAVVQENQPIFQAIEADGQILRGMLQGNLADFELFKAVSMDLGTNVQALIDKGVPMSQALALSQPQLQAMWEAQQRFGFAVDTSTQALINQGLQQGIIGEGMKSVNERILDVLLAIGKVLKADIPDALAGLPNAAQNAANGMNDAFDSVRPPDVTGGSGGDGSGGSGGDYTEPAYHSGGMIWRRMHRGGLASDEVPIIGQTGEFMMSRRGVAAAGVGTLEAINRGQSPGGTVININNPIVDSTRRIEELADALAKGGRAQTAMRHALRIGS